MEKGQRDIDTNKSPENLMVNKISFIKPKKKLLEKMQAKKEFDEINYMTI